VTLRVRHLVLAVGVVLTALVAASTAAAVPLEPAVAIVPAVSISDAAAQAAKAAPTCPGGPSNPDGIVCYHPSFLRDAYDFPSGRRGPTGAGQTIVVVTSYGYPGVADDLAQFSAEEGLPSADFTEVDQQAPPLAAPEDPGTIFNWQLETALDVEWAHAMAPGAKIVLAVAATGDSADVTQTLGEVLPQYRGAIVSLSLFADEQFFTQFDPASLKTMNGLFLRHVLSGGTVVAASGDYGATGLSLLALGDPTVDAAFPASSPFALGVGGTEGGTYPTGLWVNGHYGSEQVWNEPNLPGASGGAPSTVFPAPIWQWGLTGQTKRATPDVAYDAASNGGAIIVFGGHHTVMGGTSVGTPQWAAIVALANELRGRQGRFPLGIATPWLYLIARDRNTYRQDFHDITTGTNALGGSASGLPGFTADPGYDLATGLGTPDVSRLLGDLGGREVGRFALSDDGNYGPGRRGRGHVKFGG
jgi:subtilase family serine protease